MKRFSLLLIILLFTLTFTAQAQETVTLRWWIEGEPTADHLNATVSTAVAAAYPNIRLEFSTQENLNESLRTALLGGTAPDILQSSGPAWNNEMIRSNLVLPLTEFAERYSWQDKVTQWAYDSGYYQGDLYSLPLVYESLVLFYNKTLFDQHGWAPPTTLAELETLAAAMKAEGIHPFAYGKGGQVFSNGHLLSSYLNNRVSTSTLRAALTGEKAWTDPEFVDVINLITKHMVEEGWWVGGLETYYAYDSTDAWTELANGRAGMMMVGTWGFISAPQFFGESGQEWDWAKLPNLSEPPAEQNFALAVGASILINAATPHPEEAALVFDFLLNHPEVVLAAAEGANYSEWMIPLHFEASDFPADLDPRVARFHVDFAEVTGSGNYGYANWTFWPGPANQHLRSTIEAVWAGEMSVEDYLAAHQAVWEGLRAADNIIPVP